MFGPKNHSLIFVATLLVLTSFILLYFVQERKGTYSAWSQFSNCTVSCGGGVSYRKRSCISLGYQIGYPVCLHLGKDYEVKTCNEKPCPVNGGFASWSNYNDCSKSCGNGTKTRSRNCIKPPPMWGGKSCSHIGKYKEVSSCNEHPCPIDGGYSSWSSWSECNKNCGGGQQKRNRVCNNPTPQNGGKNCISLGKDEETKICNTKECPVDGGFGEWETWGKCDVSCGTGNRERIRKCNSPGPKNGGKECDGSYIESQSCSTVPCKVTLATNSTEAEKTSQQKVKV